MLFVIEYSVSWDSLDSVLAKRMDWEAVKPDSFTYVGEWVWQDSVPPFRGMAVVEVESVEDLNAYVLHYGPSITARIHPASNVPAAISQAAGISSPSKKAKPKRA